MNEPNHLSREEIARSIVASAELPRPVEEHLADCPLCLHRKSRLKDDLRRLGHYAEENVPPHPERIRFFSKKTRGRRRIRFVPMMAGGLVSAALAIFILTASNWFTPPMDGPVMTPSLTEAIFELDGGQSLEENPWSPFHMYAIGEAGSNSEGRSDPDYNGPQTESFILLINCGGVSC